MKNLSVGFEARHVVGTQYMGRVEGARPQHDLQNSPGNLIKRDSASKACARLWALSLVPLLAAMQRFGFGRSGYGLVICQAWALPMSFVV